MKKLNKIALVASKIIEIFHWVGTAFMAGLLICTFVARDWLQGILEQGVPQNGTTLSTYGFEIVAADTSGLVNLTMVTLFSIGAIIILALMAMVFRNVCLILKKTEEKTPFQNDVVRMLREIGIFTIAVPVISLIMNIVVGIVVGTDSVFFTGFNVELSSFFMGILVLSLSQVFAYGASLEKDVDGLLWGGESYG